MSWEEFLLNPVAEPRINKSVLTPRLDTLDKKTIGFIDIGKKYSRPIFMQILKRLKEQYNISDVIYVTKKDVSLQASQEEIDLIVSKCHFAITGVGD